MGRGNGSGMMGRMSILLISDCRSFDQVKCQKEEVVL